MLYNIFFLRKYMNTYVKYINKYLFLFQYYYYYLVN